MASTKTDILVDILKERDAQDDRWGEQNHPDVAHPASVACHQEKASDWKYRNERRVRSGKLSWDGILLEEAFEAAGETDPERLIAELIQVAAVAVAWIEAIKRRTPQAVQLALFEEPIQ